MQRITTFKFITSPNSYNTPYTFPIVIIVFRGCVPEMFCCIICHLLHTHSGKTRICFLFIAWFMMSANSRIRFGLQIVFALLYITPSSLCKLIWRHWTYKMPVRHILSSVWVRLSIFPQLSIMQYMGLCVFSLPISLVMVERIYILWLIIITKSDVWTIIHCLGSGHETMVYAVCLARYP